MLQQVRTESNESSTPDHQAIAAYTDTARVLLDVLWNDIENSFDGNVRHRLLVLLEAIDSNLNTVEELATEQKAAQQRAVRNGKAVRR